VGTITRNPAGLAGGMQYCRTSRKLLADSKWGNWNKFQAYSKSQKNGQAGSNTTSVSSRTVEIMFIMAEISFGGIGIWTQSVTLARQVLYHLNHTSSPFLLWLFWRWGDLKNYFPRLVLSNDPPDLSFPSSWDYRREPQVPSYDWNFLIPGIQWWFSKQN
jgi:hypothetical protein